MPTLLEELTTDELLLWRVRWASDNQLWCVVENFCGDMTLTIYDHGTNRPALTEVHETIASVVSRADALRDQAIAAGWEVVDVDLDEPD